MTHYKSELHSIMVHVVTRFDRRAANRKGYNLYALAQYMRAADAAYELYSQEGATIQRAIGECFNDRLHDAVLKAAIKAGY